MTTTRIITEFGDIFINDPKLPNSYSMPFFDVFQNWYEVQFVQGEVPELTITFDELSNGDYKQLKKQ